MRDDAALAVLDEDVGDAAAELVRVDRPRGAAVARSQLGGYPSFQAGQSGDKQITFNAARVVSQSPSHATVAVRTTSVRTNGTQHCGGTVELVPSGGKWLLDQISINCT